MKQFIKTSLFFLFLFIFYCTDLYAKPLIIAHRGGKLNFPENTIYAFKQAQALGVDAIELDVQVTSDGIPVVYHARDLSLWTNGSGPVSRRSTKYIKKLNAAWKYEKNRGYPFRQLKLKIPTLNEVLKEFPHMTIIIDLKSLPEKKLITALNKHIQEQDWKRLVFYSTNKKHLDILKKSNPKAITFEDRSVTRIRLLEYANTKICNHASDSKWLGFELKRKMTVIERFALGEDKDNIDFILWTKNSIKCVRKKAPNAKIVLFGINDKESYQLAKKLKVDAIYTDNPELLLSH